MSKYVIDESTLVAIGNAIRRKSTARGQLTTAQMIEIIDGLSTGAVSELQSELVDILPNFHFELMNDNQFRYTIKAIVNEIKTQESDMKIDLAQSRVELEGDDIALNDDGEPLIMFVGQTLINPVGSISVNQNGTYNVTDKAEVVVNCDVRTEEDEKNAVDIASWNSLFSKGTGNFNITSGMRAFTGDIPYIDASGYSSFVNAFSSAQAKSIKIKFSETNTNYGGAFGGLSNLERLEFSGSTRNVTNFDYFVDNCPKLKTIDGEFDFTSATSLSNLFTSCPALERIIIKPNTINANNSFGLPITIPNLTCLEVINGLNTVANYHTTAWRGTLKDRFGATAGVEATLWCKEVDGIYVDCNKADDGAISYASAITSKGWTIV